MKNDNYLYMYITDDEYELPIYVAETGRELAALVGINENTIYSSITHLKNGRTKKSRYIKVEWSD